MPRLMSVSLTRQAVVERRKTVTRRAGWRNLQVGTRLELCTKVMGRARPDGTVEPLERLALVEVVAVRRERLGDITAADVRREGFDLPDDHSPEANVNWFIQFFCDHMGGTADQRVTRVEWRYLDA